ncbi:insulinase family protein [Blastomonas marina]|uniref:M16 family metallopeptidase n=1 Tax=Blastomonas marina TaxID=1867408 RepID=UPI002AC9CDB6|nr:insulinase family protein [Blastomonas marina]WPZ04387.1 insulinase family protein [Blastomonas marina]
MLKHLFASVALPALVSLATVATAQSQDAAAVASVTAPAEDGDSDWAFEESDIPVDPGFVFGRLDNGMRYIIRQNDTPAGQGLVRMHIEAGAIDEREGESGYAHYLEHMAFNGSTNVPEGEMVKLLERKGLAFGADTNAQTGYDHTRYKLDLPNNSEDLLDTALMLMRETAGELTFAPEAVDRERGVMLAEKRDRNNFAYRNGRDGLEFAYPGSRLSRNEIAGTVEDLENATSERLRAFWMREYVPAATTLIVVGDFDPAMVEAKIRAEFSDWQREGAVDQADFGPVNPARAGLTDIYLDPSLPEIVDFSRHGAYVDEPDTIARRKENTLRSIAYGIIARRIARIARSEDPPFRGAAFSTSDVFDAGRTTSLVVQTVDGEWQRGVDAVVGEYTRAMAFGFTEAEVAEQVANRRNGLETATANQDTRSNATLNGAAVALVQSEIVPSEPADGLARFNSFADEITPETVLAALKRDAVALDDPLIRFVGKSAPEGGEAALRAAWDAAIARAPEPLEEEAVLVWPYTDFGTPGAVVSDTLTEELDIRTLRFGNGVMLNLKQTDIVDDQILVQVNIDGGSLLDTKEDPLKTQLVGLMTQGGLGALTLDELQTALAGRSVGNAFGLTSDTFVSYVGTKPRDLELQLQLLAAYLVDPGLRNDPVVRFRAGLDDVFARRYATPSAAYGTGIGRILSDGDPRFTAPEKEALMALDFEQLEAAIGDRLENGAIEIGVVGDFDAPAVIDAVAATFGALPQREVEFREDFGIRERSFTATRGPVVIEHEGEADQAQLRFIWPTADDSDFERDMRLSLLARVVDIVLTDTLREELGQAYSPFAGSSTSRIYPDYGTFLAGASLELAQLEAGRQAIIAAIEGLRAAPVDEDLLQRARQPLLENYDNALKTNGSWMSLVADAQRNPRDRERFLQGKEVALAITGEELQALAIEYLDPARAVQVEVVPKPAAD